jgi:hypothetical protein
MLLENHPDHCQVSSLVFTFNLQMEPLEHIIFEGILTDIPLGRLESGACVELEVPVCFLCFGRFEIKTEVRTPGVSRSDHSAGTGGLVAVVEDAS